LRSDPDRFEIAMLDAMLALGWGSERACAAAIVTNMIGVEFAEPQSVTRGKPARAYVATTWLETPTQSGAEAGSIDGRVGTLRKKRRRYQSAADLGWRTYMGAAFQAVLALPNRGEAERIALLAATAAGEEQEHTRLLNLIAARFSGYFRTHVEAFEQV
jgi:hypothetical protein